MLDNQYYIKPKDLLWVQSKKTVFHLQGEIQLSKLEPWLQQPGPPAWLLMFVMELDMGNIEHAQFAKDFWTHALKSIHMDRPLESMHRLDPEKFVQHANAVLTNPLNADLAPQLWLKIASTIPSAAPHISATPLEHVTEAMFLECLNNHNVIEVSNYIQLADWMNKGSAQAKKGAEFMLQRCLVRALGNKDTNLEEALDKLWKPLAGTHHFTPFLEEGLKQTQSKIWVEELNAWSKKTLQDTQAESHLREAAHGIQGYMTKSMEPKIKRKSAWTNGDMPYAELLVYLPPEHPLYTQAQEKLGQCLIDAVTKGLQKREALVLLLNTTPELAQNVLNTAKVSKAEFLRTIFQQPDASTLIEKPVFQHLFPREQLLDIQIGMVYQNEHYQKYMASVANALVGEPKHETFVGTLVGEILCMLEYDEHQHRNHPTPLAERASLYAQTEIRALLGIELSYACRYQPSLLKPNYGVSSFLHAIHCLDPMFLDTHPDAAMELTSPRITQERAVEIYTAILDDWFGPNTRSLQVMSLFGEMDNAYLVLEHFKQCYRKKHLLENNDIPTMDLSGLF